MNKYWKKPNETIDEYYNRTSTPDRPGEVITPNSLTPETPINIPEQPTDQTNYKAIIDSLNAENKALNTGTKDTSGDWFAKYLESATPPESLADQYSKAYDQTGIGQLQSKTNEAQQQLDLLNAQMQGLVAESQAIPLQLQEQAKGRAITTGGLAPIQAGQLRKVALRALPLQSQILAQKAILTGNQNALKSAQDKLDTMFGLLKTDADRQYNYRKDLRNSIFGYLTAKEKRQLDALQKKDDREYQQTQDRLKQIQDWTKTALLNGQSELITEFSSLDPKDKDFDKKFAEIQARIKAQETPTAPTTKTVGDNLYQWNPTTRNWDLAVKGKTGGSKVSDIFNKEEKARLKVSGVDDDTATQITKLLLAGKDLEEIRKLLRLADLDPALLDRYDRAVGIEKVRSPYLQKTKDTQVVENPYE